jgi:hypothetical protein
MFNDLLDRKIPPGIVVAVSCLGTLLIAYLDYITGSELRFFVFYLLPALFWSWYGYKLNVLIYSIFSNCVFQYVNIAIFHRKFGNTFYEIWSIVVSFMSFLLVTWLARAVKLQYDKNKALLQQQVELSQKLQLALSDVKTLEKLLPICCYCKSIRNENGEWLKLENYIEAKTDSSFSHGICPNCYPRAKKEMLGK